MRQQPKRHLEYCVVPTRPSRKCRTKSMRPTEQLQPLLIAALDQSFFQARGHDTQVRRQQTLANGKALSMGLGAGERFEELQEQPNGGPSP
jgi:hypothetical protein